MTVHEALNIYNTYTNDINTLKNYYDMCIQKQKTKNIMIGITFGILTAL